MWGRRLLIGQYLQAVLGMSALEAGSWAVPSAIACAVGGLIAPRPARCRAPGGSLPPSSPSPLSASATAAIGTNSDLFAFVPGSVVYSGGLAPVYLVTRSCLAFDRFEARGVARSLDRRAGVGGGGWQHDATLNALRPDPNGRQPLIGLVDSMLHFLARENTPVTTTFGRLLRTCPGGGEHPTGGWWQKAAQSAV